MDDIEDIGDRRAEGPSHGRSLTVSSRAPEKIIIVNGREHRFVGEEIDRNALARLAFPGMGTGGQSALTVAYDRGAAEAPSGLLTAGRTTRVLDGQTFSVSLTDKS